MAQIKLLEREMDGSKLLVFCETKRGCDTVTRQLRQDGWPALAIHGDKSQQERDWVLAVRSCASWILQSDGPAGRSSFQQVCSSALQSGNLFSLPQLVKLRLSAGP